MKHVFCLMCSLYWLCAPRVALAEGPAQAKAEAAARFDRGIRLVNEGDLFGALGEFQRARSLVPSAIVEYNLGLVYASVHRPVEAAQALRAALAAPEKLGSERSMRAQSLLAEQQDRIGTVFVETPLHEGVVEIDNVQVATLPLSAPVAASVGLHVVGVIAQGHAPARKEVAVAARLETRVSLAPVPIEGRLAHIALRSNVPAAEVLVDGEKVGSTPLESSITVAPGTRTLRVQRAGYLTAERSIVLSDGARAELSLSPAIDSSALAREGGELVLQTEPSGAVIHVDDSAFGVVRKGLVLPHGAHRLRLERGGFLPAERDVSIPLHGSARVAVVLEPTPETRTRHIERALRHRRVAWSLFGIGVGFGGAGTAILLGSQHALDDAQARLARVNEDWKRGAGGECDFAGGIDQTTEARCRARLDEAQAEIDRANRMRTTGFVALGLAGAGLVVGVTMLLTAPDVHRYERSPAGPALFARLRIEPQLAAHQLGAVLSSVF